MEFYARFGPRPTRMQKTRQQTIEVRPSPAMARATPLSPAHARIPSEALTIRPRVRPPITGTSAAAWQVWTKFYACTTTVVVAHRWARGDYGDLATDRLAYIVVLRGPCARDGAERKIGPDYVETERCGDVYASYVYRVRSPWPWFAVRRRLGSSVVGTVDIVSQP